METTSPASWTIHQVAQWARQARLSESTVAALLYHEIDGSTLVTLHQDELLTELGIVSLAARQYLWDLIERVRSQQSCSDYGLAIKIYEDEIKRMSRRPVRTEKPDEAASGKRARMDAAVLEALLNDTQRERQVIDDHLIALQVDCQCNTGEHMYRDADLARREHDRYQQLAAQSNRDHHFALSLKDREDDCDDQCDDDCIVVPPNQQSRIYPHRRPSEPRPHAIASSNRVDFHKDTKARGVGDEKTRLLSNQSNQVGIMSLPPIDKCTACFEEDIPHGFSLACEHSYCSDCMKTMLRAALQDSSLLPLACCKIPIDIRIPSMMLKSKDADLLQLRTDEATTTKKMYCPNCHACIFLDAISELSVTTGDVISCDCGQGLCAVCQTTSHPRVNCAENQSIQRNQGNDDVVLDMARERGWKRCPQCRIMIEFLHGCNHMTCNHCRCQFCFRCLKMWDIRGNKCSSGTCQLFEVGQL